MLEVGEMKGFIRFFKSTRFTKRKAKKVLQRINKKELTFEQAKEKGLLPPLISSMWILESVVNGNTYIN